MALSLRRRQQNAPAGRITRPRQALTAAAQRADTARENGTLRRLNQPWQQRVFTYYDTVGECWYPSQFYARTMQRVRFYPAVLNDQGEPEEQESGPLVDLFERIQGPGGGRVELAGAYGRLRFLTGDGYLTASTQDGEEAWEFLSPLELKLKQGGRPDDPQAYLRLRAPGLTPEELAEASDDDFAPLAGNDVRVWRLYRPHPAYTQLADSPIRPVLDLYELLHRLTLAASAEASSRAANRGVWYIPDDVTIAAVTPGADDDPEEDPVVREIIEGLVAAIENPGTAAAMSPFVMRGPSNFPAANGQGVVSPKDAIFWFPIGPSDRYLEGELWSKVIDRIGNSLDLPRPVITGEARNHWGEWAVDEQAFRLHAAPNAVVPFCSDLTSAYLRPAALKANIRDADRAVVWFDAAEAVNHPDQVGTAKEAHDRLVVSDAYYRDKIGATDDDAPDPEELARRTLVLLKQVPPGIDGDDEAETAPDQGGRGGDVDEAAPDPTAEGRNGDAPAVAAAAVVQTARIIGASERELIRVREVAGARARRRAQSCADCRDQLAGIPNTLVAATLGRDTVREILDGHDGEPCLVDGAATGLRDLLEQWGVHGDWPATLAQLVEQHALRTLYEQVSPPLPPGFAAAVAKAVR